MSLSTTFICDFFLQIWKTEFHSLKSLYLFLHNGRISEFRLIVKSISTLCQGAPTSLIFVRVIDWLLIRHLTFSISFSWRCNVSVISTNIYPNELWLISEIIISMMNYYMKFYSTQKPSNNGLVTKDPHNYCRATYTSLCTYHILPSKPNI